MDETTPRQMEILIKNHGSYKKAMMHIKRCETLIDGAYQYAKKRAGTAEELEKIFHKELDKRKKRKGLICY